MLARRRTAPILVGPLALALTACGGERLVQGDCQEVFGADICSWGTLAGDNVTAFGVTIPVTVIENAPLEGELVFPPVLEGVVPLPAEVTAATGFDHLGINWERHGHPPAHYLAPHFDFHFYTIAPDAVQAIDCADETKPATIPAGYTLPDMEIPGIGTLVGLCVPAMGMHALVAEELEATEPFGASMLVGYYGADLVFVEPMITRDKLLAMQSFHIDLPTVSNPGAGVTWPTSFEAVYDADSGVYRLVFGGFGTD